MKPRKYPQISLLVGGLALALAVASTAPRAQANVYATNIKLNGGLTNATAGQGSSVTISYILNEPASAGVTIDILSGATVVRTMSIAGGAAGALRGLNTVVWDGKAGGTNVAPGSYSVSITAASTGYSVWTMTTDENNEGNYVYSPRGIAVNRNPHSPYYGRVFVCNATAGGAGKPGDQVGVLKLNADGSYADEGGFSTGGHAWAGDGYSPWHAEVSDDDYVYINDWTGNGEIYRWDQTLSTASQLHVLRQDNWDVVATNNMSGPAIWGTGTNTEIYMADVHYPGSLGLQKFTVTNYPDLAPDQWVCVTNDLGTSVIPIGYPLSLYPYDIAFDKDRNYYVVQSRYGNAGDISPRVMRFPANYDYDTNDVADWFLSGTEYTDATWSYAYGIAVDPTATYVAVAFSGQGSASGNARIFYATNGEIVTNLDYQVAIHGSTSHRDRDCAWDGAGNVYVVDSTGERWRAWSPPDANSATTKPPVVLEVTAAAAPIQISNPALAGGVFTMTFTAGASDSASAFEVVSSATVGGTYSLASGQNITGSGGMFQATVPASASAQFYKIHRK